ncbi:5-deoxy-glucuronate isomerase [Asanoa iriomotensis]|uniref:5-deoxy-glucuronate isomerase n=1 Tax=Asanoa iriomotensis TaxID=234613 RepID=A0ABQ4BYF5_9ACTN|nr:5-deoxy-glucuronate isomerase [Asanoa iriomotensis]GIF55196.1 5-deoxy-glucuronate isomerase [Asanoa iriomotensis]
MSDNARWVRPLGTAVEGPFEVSITDVVDGWEHTSLRVVTLAPGDEVSLRTTDSEFVVVPLSGSPAVNGTRLAGRANVFAGPTDVAYVPRDDVLTVHNPGPGTARVALCGAKARKSLPFSYLAAAEVPVELRGAGTASREVRNFGIPGVLDADSIIACEVITPAGNWSSYPPHKHDEERPGAETALEEIYYFEVAASVEGVGDPVGYQRVYGTADRPIDVLAEVRTGDVVLVPHGWHGPAMAPPGYHLYYLNVMAGPGATRAWLICDDPAHGWVRGTWAGQAVDPRLPIGGRR